jgi:small subunit ribosomal protein S17
MLRKKLKGTIKRVSGKNTVGVEVVRVYHHPLYRKRILTSKVYLAHLGDVEAAAGMSATIEESRPISKRKRWVVVELDGKPIQVSSEELKPVSKKQGPTRKAKAESRRRKETKK